MTETLISNKEYYDNEPVHYCSRCLSLRILNTEEVPFCDKCGSPDVKEASIIEWANLYELKYKHKYIEE